MAFIVFEGLDGAGKTSLIHSLASVLKTRSLPFIQTREPGGTPLAEDVRQLLIRTNSETPVPRTELLLYAAGRAQHVDTVLLPAIKQNKWILCDRFTASSLAFQGGGRQLNIDAITWLNAYATQGLKPDLTVLLDLTVEQSRQRREKRNVSVNTQDDRFEQEAEDFHQRVRQSYLQLAAQNPLEWLVLDSSSAQDMLLNKLIAKLKEKHWLE